MAGSEFDLTRRTLSACVFVPIVAGLTWIGEWALLALVGAIVGRSTWEFYRLSEIIGHRPLTTLGMAISLGLCMYLHIAGEPPSALAAILTILLVLVAALRCGIQGYSTNVALTLVGVLYCGMLGSSPLMIAEQETVVRSTDAGPLMVLMFTSLWLTDAAAYAAGHLWGQRKLAPNISPNKTVVGAIAGTLAALSPVLLQPWVPAFSHLELLGLFFVVAVGGQLGDIVESAFKRTFGVKDAPSLIPGHGGLLDRFDSYFFAFPLACCYLILLARYGAS